MSSTRVLGPTLALLVWASVCASNLYPEQCIAENQLHKLEFLKGKVTDKNDSDGGVHKMEFRFLPRVTTSDNITGYFIELDTHVVFHFNGLGDNETLTKDTTVLCVGLASLHLLRQKDRVTAFNPAELDGKQFDTNHKGLKFFENFIEFEVKARFNSSIPVGHIVLNTTCWKEKSDYSACILSLEVEEEMILAFTQRKNPFSEEFWDSMKGYLHQKLGAELERLHTTFSYDHDNVLFRWLMWMLDQEHVNIYDFRMTSSDYDPSWGPLNDSWVQIMPLLTRLDLGNNGITELQPDYLTSVTNLTFLNLGRNMLSTIPPQIYNLTKLTFLDLSRNHFTELATFFQPRHLKTFSLVTFFNMSHVPIKHVRYIVPMLQKTNTGVEPMKLTVLDLSFCELKEFHNYPDLFKDQHNMSHLFLAGNKMGSSPKLHFPENLQLTTIDLTFNNLTTPLHILDDGDVVNLNLSLNNITDWTNYDLGNPNKNISVFRGIDHLNLSLNTIPALTTVMGNSLEELKTVDLGENLIDCTNCTIPDFQNWIRSYQANNDSNKVIMTLFNDTIITDFKCSRPIRLKDTFVTNFTFDDELCRKEEPNLLILVGIPLAAVSSLVILLGIILYAYRYEATYLLHLVKIKRRMKASAGRIEGDYKYDAFVCYSGSDRAWVVGELLPTLENGPEKYRLCLHERDFMLGTFITSNIVDAMQGSRNTIVVLTDNFVKSQWCKWELEMANHKLFEESREFLVLIELERLDRSALPRHLKYLMDTRTYLEWPELDDRTGEVEVVYRRLKEALGPSIYELEQEQEQERSSDSQSSNQDICLRDTAA